MLFDALGTTAELLLTAPDAVPAATALLRCGLAELDAAASRFRADSELSRLAGHAGRATAVSPLLAAALRAGLHAAAATGGLVDPTVGAAVRELGYDRDFRAVDPDDPSPAHPRPAPGWWRVRLVEQPGGAQLLIPRGVHLDLGATGKALGADRAAAAIAARVLPPGAGVLVSLGGDLATAGTAPAGGWLVGLGDDHRAPAGAGDPVVRVRHGALATSSVTCRSWRRGGRAVHHIVDPRTGDVPAPVWRTVTVAAHSCVDANAAATAAIIQGHAAVPWLSGLGLAARLVAHDGQVSTVGGWPAEPAAEGGSS